MIHPCSSEILFDSACQYDGTVDTDKHSYSLRKIGKTHYYYHYLDWERSKKEGIWMTSSVRKDLSKHLISLWEAGRKERWIERVLFSLGYNVNA